MRFRPIALLLVVLVAAGAILAVALVLSRSDDSEAGADGTVVSVRVGGHRVAAEVAATDESRTRGLAGRPRPDPGEGMLFVYGSAGRRDFWMRGVSFPLDMIWIRGARVVGVTHDARPAAETGTRLYPSPGPVDRVLEVRAGWAAGHGVGAGDAFRGPP